MSLMQGIFVACYYAVHFPSSNMYRIAGMRVCVRACMCMCVCVCVCVCVCASLVEGDMHQLLHWLILCIPPTIIYESRLDAPG